MPGNLRSGLVVAMCIVGTILSFVVLATATYAVFLWKGLPVAVLVGVFCVAGFIGTCILMVFAWLMLTQND